MLVGALLVFILPARSQTVPSGKPGAVRLGLLTKEVEGTSSLFFFDGRLWTCNDHGRLRLYALDTLRGREDSVVDLGVKVNDLEEVAQDDRWLYFGDFGNNKGKRKDLRILRLAKDDLRRGRYRFDTIAFTYPDLRRGPARDFDCEAFIADGDSLYLFTKQWVSHATVCYALPKVPGMHVARRCRSFATAGLVTAACYLPERRLLVLLGYTLTVSPFVYIVEDFDPAGSRQGRRLSLDTPMGTQAEGIASRNGKTFFITNESLSLKLITRKAALMKTNLEGYLQQR